MDSLQTIKIPNSLSTLDVFLWWKCAPSEIKWVEILHFDILQNSRITLLFRSEPLFDDKAKVKRKLSNTSFQCVPWWGVISISNCILQDWSSSLPTIPMSMFSKSPRKRMKLSSLKKTRLRELVIFLNLSAKLFNNFLVLSSRSFISFSILAF